jgi:tetratricopeptide (TPR) repeat protein
MSSDLPSTLQFDLDAARAAGDRAEEARVLNRVGAHYQQMLEYETALVYYEEALAINHAIGHVLGQAVTLHNSALILQAQGQLGQALDRFRQSLELRRALGDRAAEADMLLKSGNVLLLMERHAEAVAQFSAAQAIYEELGRAAQAGLARERLARAQARLNRE